MNHSFDIKHAELYGLPEAIILQNVLFWLAHNKAFNRNMRDGKPWTFNSVSSYAKLFPYWTEAKIRRYFESLEKQGVLVAGNFNQKKYDKTKWHTVADQSIIPVVDKPLANSPKAKTPDGYGENAQPIPDISTDGKQNKKRVSAQEAPTRLHKPASEIISKAHEHLTGEKLIWEGKAKAYGQAVKSICKIIDGDLEQLKAKCNAYYKAAKTDDFMKRQGITPLSVLSQWNKLHISQASTLPEWLASNDTERIISTVARMIKNRVEVPKEAAAWIPQAQARLTDSLAG